MTSNDGRQDTQYAIRNPQSLDRDRSPISNLQSPISNLQSPISNLQSPVTLSVVIPALNEENGIADIVHRVQAVEPALREVGVENLEIIVVDDGSRDRTAEIAGGFPCVRLVRHPVNRGYGAAIKTGFRHAQGELLAFLDADGTYPPEHLPDLCHAAVSQEADLVIGSRRSGADSHMPPMRRLGNLLWSNLVSLMGNHRVDDPASGMRVLQRSALVRLYPLPDGLNFTPVMSTRAVHEGLTVAEVPITYDERVGDSKLSVIHDGTRFLKTIIWTALEYNPVRVLGLVGLAALGTTGAIGLGLVALRLQGVTRLGPWGVFSLFSALVLGVAGVSIFALGATFNYLVALLHERPVHQGLFGRPIFDPPLDRHFGWLGVLTALVGAAVGGASLALGLQGWEMTRLWFWLLGSALLILVGLQLVISWCLMRVLETLSERELRIGEEMRIALDWWKVAVGDGLLQDLVEQLTHSLKVTVSSMVTLDGDEGILVIRAACPIRHLGCAVPVGYRIPLSDAPTYRRVIKAGEPVIFGQGESMPATATHELEMTLTSGLKSGALLPVQANGGVVGVISLGEMRAWERSPFTEEKLNHGLSLVARWAETLTGRMESNP